MSAQDSSGQLTKAEVLAEVERRRTAAKPPVGESQRRIIIITDRFVFWLSKHWLAIFNTLAFIYVGLPILAPVLMHLGVEGPAKVIYTVYRPLCNQLPQRSWFLFGPQFAYMAPEFMERLGIDVVHDLSAQAFIGNEELGYKIGLCERCTAIYGAIFLFGLLYVLGRRRVRSLPWWGYVAGLLPMALDGGYQFLSYATTLFFPNFPTSPYESTPLMRTITGALFGLVTVWLAYPLVQETMDEFHETLHQRFGWE
ncbi:MAG: DUF2085 domain-containing protein [Anaerolineae bacterium]